MKTQKGVWEVPFGSEKQTAASRYLMGTFHYEWELTKLREGAYRAKITVNDKYDFHKDWPASFEHTEIVSFGLWYIELTGIIEIPDDVILEMGKFIGGKPFDRVVWWEFTIYDN